MDVQSLRTIHSQEDRRSKALACLTLRLASTRNPQQGKPLLYWAGLACFRALRLKRAGLCRQHKQKGRIGIMLIAPFVRSGGHSGPAPPQRQSHGKQWIAPLCLPRYARNCLQEPVLQQGNDSALLNVIWSCLLCDKAMTSKGSSTLLATVRCEPDE